MYFFHGSSKKTTQHKSMLIKSERIEQEFTLAAHKLTFTNYRLILSQEETGDAPFTNLMVIPYRTIARYEITEDPARTLKIWCHNDKEPTTYEIPLEIDTKSLQQALADGVLNRQSPNMNRLLANHRRRKVPAAAWAVAAVSTWAIATALTKKKPSGVSALASFSFSPKKQEPVKKCCSAKLIQSMISPWIRSL